MAVSNKSIALLLSAAAVVGMSGCNGGDEKEAATAAQPYTLQSDVEKYSYSVGVLLSQDMKSKGMKELDDVAMGAAIRDVFDDKPLRLTEEQMGAALELAAKKVMEGQAAEANAMGEVARAAGEKYLAENKVKEGVVSLPSGIQYKILTEGNGEKPTLESTVVAHYHGSLIDGTVFDSSYERGGPATFALGRVVKGWQEVLPLMPVGSKWQVAIPSEMAYGKTGAPPKIGGNETLLFDIELVDIKK